MRIIMKGITVRTAEDKMSFSISPALQTLNEFFMNKIIPSLHNFPTWTDGDVLVVV